MICPVKCLPGAEIMFVDAKKQVFVAIFSIWGDAITVFLVYHTVTHGTSGQDTETNNSSEETSDVVYRDLKVEVFCFQRRNERSH